MKLLCAVVYLFLLQAFCAGQNMDTDLTAFVPALAELKREVTSGKMPKPDLAAAKMSAEKGSLPEHTWGGILDAWIAQDVEFVELLWWRKDDRATRAFIVALFWCSRPPPRSSSQPWPYAVKYFPGYAIRFSSPEKEFRMEEVKFVANHLSAIAQELEVIVRKRGGKQATDLVRRYASVAEDKEGGSLPTPKQAK